MKFISFNMLKVMTISVIGKAISDYNVRKCFNMLQDRGISLNEKAINDHLVRKRF